jgi:hypothetical protein
MKKNLGTIDRVIRILIAIVIVILYFTGIISGVWTIILLILSGIFILTGIVSFCPLYFLFGFHTDKKKE